MKTGLDRYSGDLKSDHSKTGNIRKPDEYVWFLNDRPPFATRPTFDHSKFGQVWILDPHCNRIPTIFWCKNVFAFVLSQVLTVIVEHHQIFLDFQTSFKTRDHNLCYYVLHTRVLNKQISTKNMCSCYSKMLINS